MREKKKEENERYMMRNEKTPHHIPQFTHVHTKAQLVESY